MASGRASGIADPAHTATTATRNGLDEQREFHGVRRGGRSSVDRDDGVEDISTGSPASRAAAIARALLPGQLRMPASGPTNVIPAAAQAASNSGFSDRKP